MFAANAKLDVGFCRPAKLASHLNEPADTILVQAGEGIVVVNLLVVVGIEELASVVAAEAEGHLGQVVCTEGEEVGLFCDLVGGQGGARISIDLVPRSMPAFDFLVGGFNNDILDVLELFDLAISGIMISGTISQSG